MYFLVPIKTRNRSDSSGGGSIRFDEDYVRTSIYDPKRHVSAGYEPVRPTYKGQVTETQVQQLISYIRSLAGPDAAAEEAQQ